LVLLVVLGALGLGVGLLGAPGVRAAESASPHVDALTFDREVDPASARFLEDAIETAQGDGASLLIVTLDTPGGDLDSMKAMTQKELASTVPIAVYVAPEGARAASAGMFVALAAPIVAMAPNTRIGAASPISGTGADLTPTLDQKIKSDLDAALRTMQDGYGRDTARPQEAVDKAASFTVDEALAGLPPMVNLKADSRADLLRQLDGYTGTLGDGQPFTLRTDGLAVRELEPTLINQVETVFLDPTVLFILFIVAAIGIYLELAHPGAVVPGTVGALALVLFLFGSQALDPNWAGLVLMLLGIILLAVDVRVPTHGVLTVGALIALALGSFIFFDTGVNHGMPGLEVSPLVIGGLVVGVGIVSALVLRFALRSQRMGIPSGREGLIGQRGVALQRLAPEGRVRVLGENWTARLDPLSTTAGIQVEVGQEVRILGVDGFTLVVEPVTL
jgi:membrane-bound serine protease (ClpP class)